MTESTTEWAMANGHAFRAHARTTNYDPPRTGDELTLVVIQFTHPATGEPGVVIPDALDLFRDATRAVFILDNGRDVKVYYVAAWHPDNRDAILHPFPTNYDANGDRRIRQDNGRSVDHEAWMLGPRRAYHVKVLAETL